MELNSEIPKEVGYYQLLETIGVGGMGKVYKAQHTLTQEIVAIKIIAEAHLKKRFSREAQVMAKLTHPNIVSIRDVGEEQNLNYIVMDFVEGKTFEEIKKPLPVRKALKIMQEVSLAIAFAHSNGIIHRDLKPSNLILDKKHNKTLVMDFGIAKDMQAKKITKSGEVMGTPNYMAPEQIESKKVTTVVDIYALGTIFYELLCAKKAVEGKGHVNIMFNAVNTASIPIRQHNKQVPEKVAKICHKAMAKDPKKRYQSAQEFAAEIDRCLNKRTTTRRHPPNFLQKHKLIVINVIVSLFLLVLFVVFLPKKTNSKKTLKKNVSSKTYSFRSSKKGTKKTIFTSNAKQSFSQRASIFSSSSKAIPAKAKQRIYQLKNPLWTFSKEDIRIRSILNDHQNFYITSNKSLAAVEIESRKLLWEVMGQFDYPHLQRKKIYVKMGRNICILDKKSGKFLWRSSKEYKRFIMAEENVFYDYIGRQIRAFEVKTEKMLWRFQIRPKTQYIGHKTLQKFLFVNAMYELYAIDKTTGKKIWSLPGEVQPDTNFVIYEKKMLYVVIKRRNEIALYALDKNTGIVKWKKAGTVTMPVVLVDGVLYVAYPQQIQALSPQTGQIIDTFPIKKSCGYFLHITKNTLFYGSNLGIQAIAKVSKQSKWHFTPENRVFRVAIKEKEIFFTTFGRRMNKAEEKNNYMYVLDAENGQIKWCFNPLGRKTKILLVKNQKAYFWNKHIATVINTNFTPSLDPDQFKIQKLNSQIIGAIRFTYEPSFYGAFRSFAIKRLRHDYGRDCLIFFHPNTSFFTTKFEISQNKRTIFLELRHLSTKVRRKSLSTIKLHINNIQTNITVGKGQRIFVMDITSMVKTGTNNLSLTLIPPTISLYWLYGLTIMER